VIGNPKPGQLPIHVDDVSSHRHKVVHVKFSSFSPCASLFSRHVLGSADPFRQIWLRSILLPLSTWHVSIGYFKTKIFELFSDLESKLSGNYQQMKTCYHSHHCCFIDTIIAPTTTLFGPVILATTETRNKFDNECRRNCQVLLQSLLSNV
jgi:hypothetical protein